MGVVHKAVSSAMAEAEAGEATEIAKDGTEAQTGDKMAEQPNGQNINKVLTKLTQGTNSVIIYVVTVVDHLDTCSVSVLTMKIHHDTT